MKPRNDSLIGRLLTELSWSGASIRAYREGGLGYENVLTAEALQALDFLPRTAFLGRVIEAAHGADDARKQLCAEIEEATVELLPGTSVLGDTLKINVQPDGVIVTKSTFTLLEAKRPRSSSFQSEQLAREFVRTPRCATPSTAAPSHSRKPATGARCREGTYGRRRRNRPAPGERADAFIIKAVCWITWEEIAQVVNTARSEFRSDDGSIGASIDRLARSVTDAIQRHR